MVEQLPPLRCFLSCSDASEDIALRRVFEQHCQILIQQQDLTLWSSDHLAPGTIIEKTWEAELRAAHIVLLCLTSNYFTNTRCQLELELALALAQSGQIQIFQLYLRPVNWQHDPRLVSFPCWPDSELAITSYQNHDLAFLRCVRRLSQTLHMSIPIEGSAKRPTLFQPRDLPSNLVARPQVYNAVKRQLLRDPGPQSRTTTAITTALRGAGGFGKTTLALSLCHDPEIWEAFPDGILWLTLGENPPSQLTLVHRLLLSLDPDLQERYLSQLLDEAVAQLRRLLENRACLLVLDDVWHATDIARLLEGGPRCARLITTRDDRVLPTTATRHLVDRMQIDEALHLLCQNISPDLLQTPYKTRLETLARRLGYWPLLLSLVNGVLVERIIHYKQPIPDALAMVEEAQKDDDIVAFDIYSDEDRQLAVQRSLTISLHQLAASANPSWQSIERFQELAIFPEDTDIPLTILQDLWKASGLNAHKTQDLCMLLHRLSLLLTCDLGEGTIRLHDVLRHYLIHRAGDQLPSLHTRLLDISRPTTPHGWIDLPFTNRYLWQRLIWHLHAANHIQEIHTLLTNLRFLTYKIFITNVTALEDDLRLIVFSTLTHSSQKSSLEDIYYAVMRICHLLRQVTTLSEIGSIIISHLGALPIYTGQEASLALHLPRPWFTAWHPLPNLPSPIPYRIIRAHSSAIKSCGISADGRWIVSISQDDTLKVWDGLTGNIQFTRPAPSNLTNGSVICSDQNKAISTSQSDFGYDEIDNEQLTLYSYVDSEQKHATSSDGSKLVAAFDRGTLEVWDTLNKKQFFLHGPPNTINSCGISTDGRWIISVFANGMLKVWDVFTGKEWVTLSGHGLMTVAGAISADGSKVVVASSNGTLKLWDGLTGKELVHLHNYNHRAWACRISVDGNRAVVALADGILKVWNILTNKELFTLDNHSKQVYGCAISAYGDKIVSASEDGTLKVWDGLTGKELLTLQHHDYLSIYDCVISTDGHKIISASTDGTLKIWDAITGEQQQTLYAHTGVVLSCAINIAGDRIVSASYDGTLKIWNAITGTELFTLYGHTDAVRRCTISIDGKRIVSASYDGTLKIWDACNGTELFTLYGHTQAVYGCAISPDGNWIISASVDQTLKLWNAYNGVCILTFPVNNDLLDCTFHPDGQHLIACGDQGLYFLRLIL